MWKQITGSAFCGIFHQNRILFFAQNQDKNKGWYCSANFSITLCTKWCWLAVPPSLWAQESGFGRGTVKGCTFQTPASPAADCPMPPSSSYQWQRVGCFSFGLSSSWSPNCKYLVCREQQKPTCFFHINSETGVVGSALWWRVSAGLPLQ